MKDKVQAFITISVVVMYLLLVWQGKAAVEGFAILAVYIIKKALDMIEEKDKNGKNP